MTQLGAEVEQLDGLAERFAAEARRLNAVETSLHGAMVDVLWLGDDAVTFRARWRSTMAPRVRTIAEAMEEQARLLREQARQQRGASAVTPGLPPIDIPPIELPPIDLPPIEIPPDVPPIDVPPDWPLPPIDLPPRVPPDWPPHPPRTPPIPVPPLQPTLPPDRVVRTEVVHGNGTLGVGPAQVRIDGTYRIEHLANGQVRVTELLGGQAGASASVEAWVEVDTGTDEYRGGANAGVTGTGGWQLGRTWEVPAGDLDRLIVGISLDRADPTHAARDAASGGSSVLDRLTPDGVTPFDEANDLAERYLDYRVPPPTRHSVDVLASGEALAMLGIQGGSGELSVKTDQSLGAFRESDGDIGLRYSQAGSVNGELDMPALTRLPGMPEPPAGALQGSQSIELVFGPDATPKQITMEQVWGTGDRQTVQTVTIDVDSAQLGADADTFRDFVADPSPENAARLAAVDPARWADSVQFTEAQARSSGEDYGLGGGFGFDPINGSAKVSIDTESTTYDYGSR